MRKEVPVTKAGFKKYEPPDDRLFQYLMREATEGKVEVYGAVIETAKVEFKRTHDSHRPERMDEGQKVMQAMWNAWQAGNGTQPWLYVWKGAYAVADDYFWLALIEQGKPKSIAAQVLGEPLRAGLKQKIGPLPLEQVRSMLGLDDS